MTREEKYKAKLSIDSVVQRLGDTVAAAVFEVLGEQCPLISNNLMYCLL